MPLRHFFLPLVGDILQSRPDTCYDMSCVGWSSSDFSWLFIELEGVEVDGVHRFNIVAVKDGLPSIASMVRHVMRLPWMRDPRSQTTEDDRNISFGCAGGRLLIIYNSRRYHLRQGGKVYDGSTRGWSLTPGTWNYNLGYSNRHGWIMHTQPTFEDRTIHVFGCLFQRGGFFVQTSLCEFLVSQHFTFIMLMGEDSLIFMENFPGPDEFGFTEEFLEGHVLSIWVYSIAKGCRETFVYDGEVCKWFWYYSLEQGVSFWCHNGRMIMISREHTGDNVNFRHHLYPIVFNEEKHLWSFGSRYFSYPENYYTASEVDFNFSLDNEDLNIVVSPGVPGIANELVFFSAPFASPPSLWDSAKRSMYSVKESFCANDYGGYVGCVIDEMKGTSL
jgi:hypothetical protein